MEGRQLLDQPFDTDRGACGACEKNKLQGNGFSSSSSPGVEFTAELAGYGYGQSETGE